MKLPMRIPSNSQNMRNPNCTSEENDHSHWSAEDNEIFEIALALYDKDCPDRLEKVAAMVPGKTIGEVARHMQVLEEDLRNIEAGFVTVPDYDDPNNWFRVSNNNGTRGRRPSVSRRQSDPIKKGIPWTEEEHKMFLMGLMKCGKGDWRNISRLFVVTRTPTQVASHAQKYFIRQQSARTERRRASIHDITLANLTDPITSPLTPTSSSSSSPSSPSPTPFLPQHTCHRSSSSPHQFHQSSVPHQFHQSSAPPHTCHRSSSSPPQFHQSSSPQQFHQSSSPSQFHQSSFPSQFYQSSFSPQFQWSQHEQQQHHGGGGVAMAALNDVLAYDDGNVMFMPPYYDSHGFRILPDRDQLSDFVRRAQNLALHKRHDVQENGSFVLERGDVDQIGETKEEKNNITHRESS